MSTDPKEIFSAGRFIARQKAPYFRSILLGLAPVWVPPGVLPMPTMGVTEHGILMLDERFVSMVTPDEMAALLVHEVMHVCLDHLKRSRRAGREPRMSNKADDLSINPAIEDMGLKLPGGALKGLFPEDFGFKRGLTADEYYDLLRQMAQKQGQGQGKKGGKSSQTDRNQGGQGGQGEPQDPNDEHGEGGSGGDADHDHEGDGQQGHVGGGWCGSCANNPLPNEPDEKSEAARAPNEVDRLVRQVAEAVREQGQKARGTVPAMLQRWADDILAPPEVPWQTELAIITRHACGWRDGAVQHRYDAPSRRQAGIGFGPGRAVLPRLRMPTPNVTVIIDTSGSMSGKELGEAARETNGILKAVGANVTLCTCDAAVTGVTKVRSIQEACEKLVGGGGTDMRPAFAAVVKERPRPDLIVCITDGHVGDGFPREAPPGVKVIIVLVGSGAPDIACRGAKTVRTESAKVGHAA